MNKYILADSISPTNNILTEDQIKSMTWLGFGPESTSENIVAAGYVLLPEFNTEATDTEVSVAIKNDTGTWSLTNIPFTEWNDAAKNKLAANILRQRRDKLLAGSDWTQGADVPTSISQPWATYRQALRDLPQQEGFPNTVIWPTPPINTGAA